MKPLIVPLFKIFGYNLTKSITENPCSLQGYKKYTITVKYGAFGINRFVDLYH
jgi:hypothetical protein